MLEFCGYGYTIEFELAGEVNKGIVEIVYFHTK
jgi:hypothetical protein